MRKIGKVMQRTNDNHLMEPIESNEIQPHHLKANEFQPKKPSLNAFMMDPLLVKEQSIKCEKL